MLKNAIIVLALLGTACLAGCSKQIGVSGGSAKSMVLDLRPDASTGKDATLWDLKPQQNYGSHPQIIGSAWTNGGEPSNLRALFDFDLSRLPKKARILSAKLYLYHHVAHKNPGHAGTNQAVISRVIEPWDEQQVSWSSQPATTPQNQVLLAASTAEVQNYVIDISQLVRDARKNPKHSYGFLLQQVQETHYRSLTFASSDVANEALRPRLVVEYSLRKL